MIVLSYIQASQLQKVIEEKKQSVDVSLDLGKSISTVQISNKQAEFPGNETLSAKDIEKIAENESVCYLVRNGKAIKIQLFGKDTNKLYKLLPTNAWPTIEISGVRMHRVKEVNPMKDTQMKIRAIHPVFGRVLDTCTGLGYTAILASEKAAEVITHERDLNVLEIARHNPWSQELFSSPKIKLVQEDVNEAITSYSDAHFERIIHDPPRVGLSGELYSLEFYKQLYRVLKRGGKLYHYTGDPGKVTRGNDVAGGVMQRLAQAGFVHVKRKRFLLGVIGIKK